MKNLTFFSITHSSVVYRYINMFEPFRIKITGMLVRFSPCLWIVPSRQIIIRIHAHIDAFGTHVIRVSVLEAVVNTTTAI